MNNKNNNESETDKTKKQKEKTRNTINHIIRPYTLRDVIEKSQGTAAAVVVFVYNIIL